MFLETRLAICWIKTSIPLGGVHWNNYFTLSFAIRTSKYSFFRICRRSHQPNVDMYLIRATKANTSYFICTSAWQRQLADWQLLVSVTMGRCLGLLRKYVHDYKFSNFLCTFHHTPKPFNLRPSKEICSGCCKCRNGLYSNQTRCWKVFIQ